MSNRITKEEYNGKTIYIIDYSGLIGDVYPQTVAQVTETLKQEHENGIDNMLLLIDVTDSSVSKNVLEAFNRSVETINPFVHAMGVVGVKGLKKVFLFFAAVRVKEGEMFFGPALTL